MQRQENPEGQSRMNNPETLKSLGTQDTGRRQTNTTQKLKQSYGDKL